MEVSIGGSGYRATINSYMYGDAVAIANIADWAGKRQTASEFRKKAARLKAGVETRLWDPDAGFFKVLPRAEGARLADVRELHGYVPWYFNLPDPGYEIAWKQLMDPGGFYAPYGPTTAERRSPQFMFGNPHECLWNGPSWPFATTQTLVAMANLLNQYQQDYVGKKDYLELLRTYAHTQYLKRPDGKVIPWIDEDYNPITGEPLAREILYRNNDAHKDRGRDYNHSGYDDLIISGLVGLRPRIDQLVEVNPLLPEGGLTYFCLDGVPYHGTTLTILYDQSGNRYHKGPGLHVFAGGQEIANAARLQRLTAKLPETAGGWRKYDGNPVIGGQYGTVFDVAVLREGGEYRMWGSWRPGKSLALFTSEDGMHWSEPEIVFGPNTATRWENDINRPCRGEASRRLSPLVHRPGRWAFLDRLRDQRRRQDLDAHESAACAIPRPAMGESGRDVPACHLGREDEALSHVVFGRRAVRAECHRICHQFGWPALDQARRQSHFWPGNRKGVRRLQGDGVPGSAQPGVVLHVLHRLSRH